MEILLITQEFPPATLGGVGYHAYYLANALAAQGHSVHVVSGISKEHQIDESSFSFDDLEVTRLAYRRLPAPRLWFNRAVQRWLRGANLKRYDVIHSHELLDFGAINFSGVTVQKIHYNITKKKEFVDKNISGWHRVVGIPLSRLLLRPKERALEKRALRTSDIQIYNSKLTRSVCRQAHGLPNQSGYVIYNGVDASVFRPIETVDDDSFMIFCGGTSIRKGYGNLLEAIKKVRAPFNKRMKIIGDDYGGDRGKLPDAVEFVGRLPQQKVRDMMQRASALVHPASYEPFGNVVIESLSCGTPVIVSDANHCGAAEILTDETGIAIDPSKPAAFGRSIEEFDPDNYRSEACRQLALNHSWSTVANFTIEAIRKATSKQSVAKI